MMCAHRGVVAEQYEAGGQHGENALRHGRPPLHLRQSYDVPMTRVLIACVVALSGAIVGAHALQVERHPFPPTADHLVYATPDLQMGVDRIERLLGVRAAAGGQHPGRGTRNALVALGPATYLEIIGPDPEQPTPKEPRPFGIDGLREPRLMAWASKSSNLEQLAGGADRHGVK